MTDEVDACRRTYWDLKSACSSFHDLPNADDNFIYYVKKGGTSPISALTQITFLGDSDDESFFP